MGSVVPAVVTTSSPPSAPATEAASRASRWGVAALALAAATVLLRLPAFFADRHLTVDDGVFGASAMAMRTGAVPFRDVPLRHPWRLAGQSILACRSACPAARWTN